VLSAMLEIMCKRQAGFYHDDLDSPFLTNAGRGRYPVWIWVKNFVPSGLRATIFTVIGAKPAAVKADTIAEGVQEA